LRAFELILVVLGLAAALVPLARLIPRKIGARRVLGACGLLAGAAATAPGERNGR